MTKTIVLINPPGADIYIRDYYCSKISKTGEVYFPLDLIYQSAYFTDKNKFNCIAIDCIAENLDVSNTIARLKKINKPIDYMIALSASVSFLEDKLFFEKIKEQFPNIKIFVSADYALDLKLLKENIIAAVDGYLLDFTSADIYEYIGDNNLANLTDLLIAEKLKDINFELGNRKKIIKNYSMPQPQHFLFDTKKYRYPFNRFGYCRGLLASFGCPYNCSYCVSARLPYKIRALDEILTEIENIRSYNINELHFDDQTFLTEHSQDNAIAIANHLIKTNYRGGWVCFLRADYYDFETLKLFKQSGLHTVMVGVETENTDILNLQNKKISKRKINRFFEDCYKLDIDICATFMLGFPGETKKSMYATINTAIKLSPMYAAFNTVVAKPATTLREKEFKKNNIENTILNIDQNLAKETFKDVDFEILNSARSAAYQSFYLRFSYFWRRFKRLNSFFMFKQNFKIFLWLIRKFIF